MNGSSVEALSREPRVVVIGAGFSGLLAGIKLREAGIDDFVIYEKAGNVGGTWRDNVYPGVGCDLPSHLYCYSFEPNSDWSRRFAPGEEIQQYLERVARKYGLLPHLRLGCEVHSAAWNGAAWNVALGDGSTVRPRVVVAATGVLHHPASPDIPGLETFAGAVVHTARWCPETPVDGVRVGIIGTGTSAAQVVTSIVDRAARLTVFQRTPNWVLRVRNPRSSRCVQGILRRWPWLMRWSYAWNFELYARTWAEALAGNAPLIRWYVGWLARRSLRAVRDPELRRRLTPSYPPGCKRVVFSDTYYAALQRPHVSLVTSPIVRIAAEGVHTADGRLHRLDTLILATGFRAHDYLRPMRVTGAGGVALDEVWRERPLVWRSIAVPQMPNFFFVVGPFSPIASLSVVQVAEWQVGAIIPLVARALRDGVALSPTLAATTRYMDELVAAAPKTVWMGGCQSWYLGTDGVPELYTLSPFRHRADLRAPPDWSQFHVEPLATQ
jgi:cation diffusion facilitator CzcD-associated flavoprotein CzcO